MIYVVATLSAVVTGGILAVGVRALTGLDHSGALLAIGILGGALQWLALLGWYLYHTREKPPAPDRAEPGI